MSDEELDGGQQRGAAALRGMRSEEDWQRLVVEFKASGLSPPCLRSSVRGGLEHFFEPGQTA